MNNLNMYKNITTCDKSLVGDDITLFEEYPPNNNDLSNLYILETINEEFIDGALIRDIPVIFFLNGNTCKCNRTNPLFTLLQSKDDLKSFLTNKNGKIINIEGIDGVGKTTIINKLKYDNPEYIVISFPDYTTTTGKLLKSSHDYSYLERYELYLKNRLEKKVLLNHYRYQGRTVILDRYVFSSYAYNFLNDKEERSKVIDNEFNFYNLPLPDMVIYLYSDISSINDVLSRRLNNDANDMLDINIKSQILEIYKELFSGSKQYAYTCIRGLEEDTYENIITLVLTCHNS